MSEINFEEKLLMFMFSNLMNSINYIEKLSFRLGRIVKNLILREKNLVNYIFVRRTVQLNCFKYFGCLMLS